MNCAVFAVLCSITLQDETAAWLVLRLHASRAENMLTVSQSESEIVSTGVA